MPERPAGRSDREATPVSVRSMTDEDRAAVLAINARNSPHVATLDQAELSRLLGLGARTVVATDGGGAAIGYLIAFERGCPYEGEEFLALRQDLPEEFLYIDQLAVAPAFRGLGTGRKLYGAVEAAARSGRCEWLCCEVNEQPPNPGSLAFHRSLGFEPLRRLETRDGRRVVLLARRSYSTSTTMKATIKELLPRIPGKVTPKWPDGERFAEAMKHGTMLVEVYVPVGSDTQTPHLQDELYFVHAGSGTFRVGDERHSFEPGACLFVPAGVEHRFEQFTPDFAAWAVFWGPEGGEQD